MRKKAGDQTIDEIYGYKRLEDTDGQPITTDRGYHIYKQINLLGDGQYASEYKLFPTQSPINNGTVKIEQELPDNDIIRFLLKDVSPVIPATLQTSIPNEPVTNRVIVPEQVTSEKEFVSLDTITLKDGSTYNRADINAEMLEKMEYTPEEIGEILKSIC
jgi:hypothetical protein